jgi:hypothetical protein
MADSKNVHYIHHLLSFHQETVQRFQPVQGTFSGDYLWSLCAEWAHKLGTTTIPIMDIRATPSTINLVNGGAALRWVARKAPQPTPAPESLSIITTRTMYHTVKCRPKLPNTIPGTYAQEALPQVEEWSQARIKVTSSRLPPQLLESRWRILMGYIPSNSVRHGWDPSIAPKCPRCGHPNETPMHLVWDCPWAQSLWKLGNYILLQWPGAPSYPISQAEGIWSIQPNPLRHYGREVMVAFIGLTVWRTRWLTAEHQNDGQPGLTHLITMLTNLGQQMEDLNATNIRHPAKGQLQTCPLLNAQGKTAPIPIRILHQAACNTN